MENKISVSIITPAYNSERFIKDTIKSVQSQTYDDWEMVIVDDGSTDNTWKIIEKYAANDTRIRIYKNTGKHGAAYARNLALKHCRGRFIAYLDSDDIWKKDKLKKQVKFMLERDVYFSCASYEVVFEDGLRAKKEIHMLPVFDYDMFLKNNLLQTVGIMVDTKHIDKKYLIMPPIERRQDAATWLKILKQGYDCYGIYEVLGEYRRRKSSLSANKIKAIKGMWYLYRNIEKLPVWKAAICFMRYALFAVYKRIYLKKILKR